MKILLQTLWLAVILISCNSSRQALKKEEKQLAQPVLSETLQQQLLNGTDLFAKGSLPSSWTMEMDFGKGIRFKSLDGTEINSSSVQPVPVPESKAVSYTSNTSNGNMIIMVYDAGCKDAFSRETFTKKVTVTTPAKMYEGCGQYLFNPALNGKWQLEKINNEPLTAAPFPKGLPQIIFDIVQNQVAGHDGCNAFSSAVEVMGSQVKFNEILRTEMACPGIKKAFDFIPKLNNQFASYYFKDGQLVLYLSDDSNLYFRKIE